MAFLSWNRNPWKTFRLRQYAIELCDHVIEILELCILFEITFSVACRSNAWSQAYHGTTHDGAC